MRCGGTRPTMNRFDDDRYRWRRMGLLLRPASLGLACQAQLACYYHDNEGYQSPHPPPISYVYVADYAVTDTATGVLYGSGCRATEYADCVGCTIYVNVPYGVQYALELTNFRYFTGDMSEQDAGYYCEAPYESQSIQHRNPTCYRTASSYMNAELLDASVLDATGNKLASAYEWIVGTNTDVERFAIRSSSWGSVEASLAGSPCNDTSTTTITLLIVPET
jgi:hypothetical protein